MEFIVNSDVSLQNAIGSLRDLYREYRYVKVRTTTGTKRSLSQNDISHAWYEQVSNELREGSPLDVKAESKLVCGVPILRAEVPEFREKYDALLRQRFTYEEKLALMAWFPVTSLMTKAQLSQYLEAVQRHWGQRGVRLEFPEAA